jgi:hypothetical protein
MTTEILTVTWKFIRNVGYRTPEAYCSYIAENENHKHKLKTVESTKLFKILKTTTVSANEKYEKKVIVDGMYRGNKLIYITNPRIL